MLFSPSLERIVRVMDGKGYVLYRGPEANERSLNLVGIRRRTLSPDRFDDSLAVFHLMPGASDLMLFPLTTDPSPHYLHHPLKNTPGTAILSEGQYVDTYAIGPHSPPSGNSHEAVCQDLRKVRVFRDNTRDGKLNLVNAQAGMFGINIHRGPRDGDWDSRNTNYSAGCQVFADRDDFEIFMNRCRKERRATRQNVFTYTLLNESDFD